MKVLLAVIALLAAASMAGCGAMVLEGSGNVVSDDRNVSGFDSVALACRGELTIRQSGQEGLTITADDNILTHIMTEVRGGTLRIGMSQECARYIVRPSTSIRYELTVKDLSGISVSGSGCVLVESLANETTNIAVSGSGRVRISELTTRAAAIAISGSGDVVLGGETGSQTVAISGSGEYEASDLMSDTASVTVSGSGDATVAASQKLTAHLSGSGSIGYHGEPEVDSRVSGSGRVRRLDSETTSL
jgi:hypothetical protein